MSVSNTKKNVQTVALGKNTFCCMSLSLSLKLHRLFYYAFTWMELLEHHVLFTF